MSDFKVKFRGVRGSHPTPYQTHLNYGGNTSCVEVWAGKRLIILDAGTGIIPIGDDLMREHILSGNTPYERIPIETTIILSHVHQDHIQGFPFFKPLLTPTSKINVFGPVSKNEDLKTVFSEVVFNRTFPMDINDIPSDMEIKNFNAGDVIILSEDNKTPIIKKIVDIEDVTPKNEDVVITTYKSAAHPQHGTLIIKIAYKDKVLVYATDKESYIGGDKKFTKFAYGADLLIHDSQYTDEDYLSPLFSKQGFGHSTFKMAIEASKLAKTKKLAFYHFDPGYNDDILKEIEFECKNKYPDSFFCKEDMEITI